MTRMPGPHRLSGEQVMLFVENIRERLKPIILTAAEYYATIRRAAETGIMGGTIYDALIARCALKADADALYTWNAKHFAQFGPAIAKRLRAL